MSENFNSQNSQSYRDNLAESLRDKRDLEGGKDLAKEQLEMEKDTVDYKRAKIQHKEDNLVLRQSEKEQEERIEKKKENVKSSGLEWAPEQWNSTVSLVHIKERIMELNKNLKEGEKPWRLPTKAELLAEFKKTPSTLVNFMETYYWTSDANPINMDEMYVIAPLNGGFVSTADTGNVNIARACLVR